MTDFDLAARFLERLRCYLGVEYPTKITAAERTMLPNRLWWRLYDGANSVGNLVVQLAGDVRRWAVSGIGETADVQNRDAEFVATSGTDREELLVRLQRAVGGADAVVAALDPAAMGAPRRIQGRDASMVAALYQVVEHFAGSFTRRTGLRTGLLAVLLMACGGASTGITTGSPTGTPTGTPSGGTSTPVTRILWIGNSYTYVNDLPALLTALSTTAGRTPLPSNTTVLDGGQTLKGAAGRADISAVMARGWDIVVLQEQSTTPITAPDTMLRYGSQLGEMAKQAGAKVLLFQTWPAGDATPSATAIRAAYDQLARAVGATVVPVGDAWLQMMTARPDLALYQDDGSHPTAIGTYLAACVFHNLLHSQSAIGLAKESYSVRTNRYAGGLLEPIVKIPLDAAVALAAQQAADRATGR